MQIYFNISDLCVSVLQVEVKFCKEKGINGEKCVSTMAS